MSDQSPKRGDRRSFGTYWSINGPVRIDISEWIYDGEQWVMPGSPIAQQIEIESREASRLQ